MVMSTYMDLLGLHAPWFLILFMVIPMTLAELILAAEIFSLLKGQSSKSSWNAFKKVSSLALSLVFIFLFLYLVLYFVPSVSLKGPLDSLSIYSYLLAILPAIYLLAMECGFIGKHWDEERQVVRHAVTVFVFVALTHLAMIFGMLDPQLGGYVPPQDSMNMHMDHSNMGTMDHQHMDHSDMKGMDHSQMDHSQMDHSQMDHSKMNHDSMDHQHMDDKK